MPRTLKAKSNQSNCQSHIKHTSQNSASPKSMALKPCDRCRKHRIKCNRNSIQCNHCERKGLECTYLNIPKKRGPKSRVDAAIEYYQSLSSKLTKNCDSSDTLPNEICNQSNDEEKLYNNSTELVKFSTVPTNPFEYNCLQQPLFDSSGLNLGNYTANLPLYTNELTHIFNNDETRYGIHFPQWDMTMDGKNESMTLWNMPPTNDLYYQSMEYDQLSYELLLNYTNLNFVETSENSSIGELSPQLY